MKSPRLPNTGLSHCPSQPMNKLAAPSLTTTLDFFPLTVFIGNFNVYTSFVNENNG